MSPIPSCSIYTPRYGGGLLSIPDSLITRKAPISEVLRSSSMMLPLWSADVHLPPYMFLAFPEQIFLTSAQSISNIPDNGRWLRLGSFNQISCRRSHAGLTPINNSTHTKHSLDALRGPSQFPFLKAAPSNVLFPQPYMPPSSPP